MTPTPGTLAFDMVPRLPVGWEKDVDSVSVWPVWGQETLYLWGANVTNQFIARGDQLHGGGMASVQHGPTRGLGHPRYVGIDTMELSPKANDRVFDDLEAKLASGTDIVVPVYMVHGDPDNGKIGLGSGYGLDVDDHVQIHAYFWGRLLRLAAIASSVTIPSVMWTPDVTQPDSDSRASTRMPLPDLAAVTAWQKTLAAVN